MVSVSSTTPRPTSERLTPAPSRRLSAMNAPQPARKPLMALDEALADLLARVTPLSATEVLATVQADGRVLADDLVSALHVPPQDNSSMDGYAVRTADVTEKGTVL